MAQICWIFLVAICGRPAYLHVMLLVFLRLLSLSLIAVLLVFALLPQPPEVLIGQDYHRHMFAFLIVTSVSAVAFRKISLPVHWIIFVALGGAIEVLQLKMGMGRVGEWDDWYADIGAVTAAVIGVWLFRPRVPEPAQGDDASDGAGQGTD